MSLAHRIFLWLPYVVIISLKAALFFGDAGTEFGGLKDKSLIDLSAKISF